MQEKILDILSEITDEEQYILVQEDPDQRSIYSKPGRFIIERRHISSMSLGEATAAVCIRSHPRFREFPKHSHDYIEIMYVCSGSITHVIDGKEIRLGTDELIILAKDTAHSIGKADKDDIGINLIISADLFESLYRSMKKSSQLSSRKIESLLQRDGLHYCVFSAADSVEIKNIVESMIYSTICENRANGYILMQSVSLLLSYLASLSDDGENSSEVLGYNEQIKKKISNYIQSSYSTATLTEAAEMLGLSPSYLSRLIREIFGASFKELLMTARFDTACALLSTTEFPIGDIINAVGYENSSYFHKEFKKRFGQTPNGYRKDH